jgi:hypothetical protein
MHPCISSQCYPWYDTAEDCFALDMFHFQVWICAASMVVRPAVVWTDKSQWQDRSRLDQTVCTPLWGICCGYPQLCNDWDCGDEILAHTHVCAQPTVFYVIPICLRADSRLSLVSSPVWPMGHHHRQPNEGMHIFCPIQPYVRWQ